jgi:hypothetical protein
MKDPGLEMQRMQVALKRDPSPPRERLRTQLVAMREMLIERLATKIEGGDLALLETLEFFTFS